MSITPGTAALGLWAQRCGTVASEINLHLTTDAAGAAQEGTVYVTIRPLDLASD